MSGGQLVVLDRLGREVKRFPLASGLATLGSDPRCDIRVTLPDVCPHHATVVVHANQTVVRNVGDGQTLVNGRAISVAALRHGDRVSVGGRELRWDYDEPAKTRPLDPQPALYSESRRPRSRARNSAGAPAAARSPALQLAIELQHRASMPGSAGGKQVAIVQPQRRDTSEQNDASLPRSTSQPKRRSNPEEVEGTEGRKSSPRHSPKALHSATKASMWIESRKSTPRATPRKAAKWGAIAAARGAASARKATPLRLAVLRRAASLSKVQPPKQLDQTKQVAIMLMTGHTPASKLTLNQRRTPSFVAKKPSPGTRNTPRNNTSTRISTTRRTTGRTSGEESVSILEISDSTRQSSPGVRSRRSQASSIRSPLLPSPKKSAMKDPTAKKSSRKTESIKFDLSNLENHSYTDMTSNSQNSVSEDDLTLHYDTSSVQSPSPRKSIHSRSSRMLEKTLGTTIEESPNRSTRSTLTPQTKSPSKKSSRGSIIMQKALESDKSSRYSSRTTKTLTDQSSDTTIASAYRTKTLSPRSPRNNLETYSIVDLVSMDSNESESQTSVYNSAGSENSSTTFGTPHNSSGRKTRSTIDPLLVETSTPYVAKTKKSLTRSLSSPNISRQSSIKGNESQTSVRSVSSRRSKSEITPENTLKHITVDSTRISRGSRSRSRLSESDLLLISDNSYEDESPRSSKKSRPSKSSPQQRMSFNQSSPNVMQRSSIKTGDVRTSESSSQQRKSSNQSSPNVTQRSSRKTGDITPNISNQSSPNIQRKSSRKTEDVTPNNLDQSSPNIQRSSSRKTEDVTLYNSNQSFPNIQGRSSRKTGNVTPNNLDQSSPNIQRKSSRKTGDGTPNNLDQSSPNIQRKSSRKTGDVTPNNLDQSSPNIQRKSSRKTGDVTPNNLDQSSPNIQRKSSRKTEDVTLNNSNQSFPNIQGRSSRKTGDVTSNNSNQSFPNIQGSRKTGDGTSNSSNQSTPNIQRRSSRKTGDVTSSNATQNEGMSTPENRHSPEEIGTPVLSIQSLLNSSQSSLASQNSHKKSRASLNLKRKTIAAIRSEPKTRRTGFKSRSLNFTARRGLLRLSNDSSDKEENSGDKMVTPKSGVKLVQEAVKNKHSTAKKPQSKRSIIDNLDESADIVKQLFNSPVKRKLSQSMTEFSRKHLSDDEGIAHVKRPTRNTIALTGRTPEDSISEHTEVFTPERFVSPIGTPASSPDLTGVKRILRKNTPVNDLTNVKGVKSLLRTPRTRKSVKNDLTNVSGVKKVFAKSPKNRLSDVRVKEVFAEGPKDDLRRVSGVKSLFQTQKKNKSPRNDLTDVRGVKKLFQRKSPKNDLTRVSGVKRTLRRHSPRNDLTDVRGVKRMYGEEKRKDDLTDVRGVKRMYGEEKRKDDLGDVSGVEELFNESTASKDTDLLFDRLLGRPPVRAKYSKSFIQKPAPKKTRKARSLRYSIDEITNNVEEWLEKELEKCLHKKSKKSNRELQNLTTDTVEGVAPVIDSRVRRSFVDNSERRSASEVYSARKLPIKKRSLIDRQSTKLLDLKSNRLSNNLPLKKRVLHSTPLKGRRPAAPALARVSPIPPVADHDTSISSDQQPKEPEPKSKRATKAKQTDPIPASNKRAPKTTHPELEPQGIDKKATPQTRAAKDNTPKTRVTRNRQKSETTQNNTKKSRPSLVIAKKSPVMSPKPTRTRRGKQEPVKETLEKKEKPTVKEIKEKPKTQKKVVAQKDIPKVPTPKKTRGRKQTEEIVVPSPKKTRGRKQPEQKVVTPKATPKKTRTRKTEQEKPKEPTPKQTRAKVQRNVVVISKPSPKLKPQKPEATRRPRKTTASENNESMRDTKRRKVESPKAKSSKTELKEVVPKTTRGRRNLAVDVKPQETAANTSKSKTEARKTRTRNLQTQESTQSEPTEARKTRTRNVQTQESTQSEPTSKRRKKEPETTVVPEVKSRKRKTTAEEVVPNKIAKNKPDSDQATRNTRGRKTADVEETARGRKTADVVETAPKENTRQKRGTAKQSKAETEVAAPPARGRKTAVAAPAPRAARARKTEAKASPVKAAEGQKVRSTRARAAVEESAKPTGRSRRR